MIGLQSGGGASPPDEFERHVIAQLDRRASGIAVEPDVEALTMVPAAGSDRVVGAPPGRTGPEQRAVWLAAAAVVVLGLLGVGALAGLARQDRIEPDAGRAGSAATDGDATFEMVVWLEPGTPDERARTVGAWLEDRPSVRSWSYVDESSAWIEFAQLYAEEPEIVELIEPDQLPTSYRVLTSDPDAITAGLKTGFDFVDQVETSPGEDGLSAAGATGHTSADEAWVPGVVETIVWFEVGTTDDQATSVGAWLEDQPSIQSFTYINQFDTWLEFTDYYADEPEIIDLVEPDQLPTSYRVLTSDPDAITAGLKTGFDFVDEVESGTAAGHRGEIPEGGDPELPGNFPLQED